MLLPFAYFTDFNNNNNERKEGGKKDKRKRLNGWCPLGHNDKLWYDIKNATIIIAKV